MSGPSLRWYARRLARMSPAEVVWRTGDQVRRTRWASLQVRPGQQPAAPLRLVPERQFTALLPADARDAVPAEARVAVIKAADEIFAGHLDVLGVARTDLVAPDWFLDPVTGKRSSPDAYAFRINHRSENETGNVKQVWELSRQHHLTLLASAWYLTGDDAYAQRVADQLRSWWRENPFLSGIHWTSGIETGIRLIGWAWIRRLLADWPGVHELFDGNDLALRQLYWHQRFLAGFVSRGSSANNHVIAEAAGRLVAACAFPWFAESGRWRADASALLARELDRNTFGDGLNRELASDYHRFVAELGLLAAVEADAAGTPLRPQTWELLTRMYDAAAAVVDETGRPPRQGDGDEGRALVLDPPDASTWTSFLALGEAAVGRRDWWPRNAPDVSSALVGSLLGPRVRPGDRPVVRPSHFADAGMTLLRTRDDAQPEIWCRCDGGPHGFLSIAAHAHADALSVELRVGGVDVLADPGTYCYHGDPTWRGYFRSTLAHNTVELADRDQSVDGGPFLWLRHARTRVLDTAVGDDEDTVRWTAEHDGYRALAPPATHRRTVSLDRVRRVLHVEDRVTGGSGQPLRMAYHLGPDVSATLDGTMAELRWPSGEATLDLPGRLSWTLHRGSTSPAVGWYSPRLGQRVPTFSLVGTGDVTSGLGLHTLLTVR